MANIFLALLKTSVGILGHSPALLAEGVNSTSDVAYYVVVAVFMRLSHKPADETHPYGHNQLESIASLVVGAFIVTTAIAVFWNAVNDVFELFTVKCSPKAPPHWRSMWLFHRGAQDLFVLVYPPPG